MQYASAPSLLKAAVDSPDLVVINGSRLYGTQRTDANGVIISDIDIRGFVMPPWEYLVRMPISSSGKKDGDTGKQWEWDIMDFEGDHIIYNVRWFFATLIGSNPQLVECLFAPESHIVKATDAGRAVIAAKDAFISKRFYKRITGFGNSEWRKARGVKDLLPTRTPTEKEIIEDIRNVFGPTWPDSEIRRDKMNEIIEILFSGHERQQVSSYDGISAKRRHEFDEFGYCVSSACHSVRLMEQCSELLRTGSMTFPRPNAELLRDIKQGRLSLEETTKLYEAARLDCDEAYAGSTLPELPDIDRIKELYLGLVARSLVSDRRLQEAAKLSPATSKTVGV